LEYEKDKGGLKEEFQGYGNYYDSGRIRWSNEFKYNSQNRVIIILANVFSHFIAL
jgi:hypothetical protein